MIRLVAPCALLLAGCQMLKPVSVPIEVTHVSHLTQHWPFTDHPTCYGFDSVSVGLKWQPVRHMTVVLEEGMVLENRDPNFYGYGSLAGPRELFTGRVTYEVPLR